MRWAGAVLLLFLVWGQAADGAYARASLGARELLLSHYEALGGLENLKAEKTVYSEGIVRLDGLKGSFKSWYHYPLQFRFDEDFGVIRQITGDSGQITWLQDTSGKVIEQRDEGTLKRRQLRGLLERYEHVEKDTKHFTLISKKDAVIDGRACYVIKMTNRINDDIYWYYLSKDDFLMVKSIVVQPDFEAHSRYKDYRNVNAVRHPFYVETDILPRQRKEIVQVTRYESNIEITSSKFQKPVDSSDDYHFVSGEQAEHIPFELIENNIYLMVSIGDSTRRWILDNGASKSVVDADYARELGLVQEGSLKGFGFTSTFDLSFVTIPAYRLQGVEMGAQKIFAYSGLADQFGVSDVGGILGFDFMSRFVTKVDYGRRQISLYNPLKFGYFGPGIVLDAPLKYRIFGIPMRVDRKYSGKWDLDLGAFNTAFHYPYAKEHQLLDMQGVERLTGDLGGEYKERNVEFKTAQIAAFKIERPIISVPLQAGRGKNISRDRIGNIGNSLLRHFTLYLDYERQQVILEKGKEYGRKTARDKSGILLSRFDDEQIKIVYVAANTPGAKAGFCAGDRIIAVDETLVEQIEGGAVSIRQMLRQAAGRKYTFRISRNGKILDVTLTLENLFP